MIEDWKTYKLNEVCSLIVDCPHSTPKWTDKGVFVLRSHNIRKGKLNYDNISFTDHSSYLDRTKRAVPQGGDVIITREAPMGEVCMLPPGITCCMGQRMVLLRPITDKIRNEFLLYVLQSRSVQGQIMAYEGTGSTVSNLRIPVIEGLNIPVPPLPEQRAIASILSALDDKIELNLQMNKTLEEMAMTLYKHWFVDFGPFRDTEFVPSELGEIPKGWEVKTLGEEFKITIGRTPPRNEHEWFSNVAGIKWISIKDMGIAGTYIFDTSEYLTENAVESKNVPKIPVNTVILSFKLTVGRVSITTEEMVSNEAIAHFIHKSATSLKSEYLYLALKSFDYNSLASTSSIATAVNSQTVKGIRVIVPESSVIEEFDREVSPLFKMIKTNSEETQTLTTLRDTLLPKLISGEVRVKDAARTLAEVV